jgi:RNA polymerase sigma-70 factor (sigma-E family)
MGTEPLGGLTEAPNWAPASVDDFDAYVLARGDALVRLARGLLKDPHHAEDVVQEVLAKAHQRWGTIVTRDSPDAYVLRMVLNASTSFWRRAARREFAVDDASLPDRAGPDGAIQIDDRSLLVMLLRGLPPKQRAVLVLRHYQDMPDDEIARVMGVSIGTVRSNAHRGLARMRRALAVSEEQP